MYNYTKKKKHVMMTYENILVDYKKLIKVIQTKKISQKSRKRKVYCMVINPPKEDIVKPERHRRNH